jgi:NifU-like protein
MAWNYSEKTKQLFMDAVQGKPSSHLGEVEDPDGLGEHGSIACGDALRFTFRVRKHASDPLQDVITLAKYLTFGCTSAIAASEALCLIIEERKVTPLQALEITNDDIVAFLEGLPDQKIHCSVMGAEALAAAVFNWAQRRGVDLDALGVDILPDETEEGRLVCKCFGLTEPYLLRKIRELGLESIAELTAATKAGGACMTCHHQPGGLQDLLDQVWGPAGSNEPAPAFDPTAPIEPPAPVELSPFQFMKKVEQVLDSYVRPMLQADGGDLEIIDIKDRTVYVRLAGACSTCVGASQTLKHLVQRSLEQQVDERVKVIAV